MSECEQNGNEPRAGMIAAIGSVIIPAHNEEASIGRCLAALLGNAKPGEFEVIVICNGCQDDTAGVARTFGTIVRVIEIEIGSKVLAINLGNKAARFYPRLYLDADLEISTEAARKLLNSANDQSCLAAIGTMDTDISEVPWLLRQYYAVWKRNGYLKNGKFGGAYALSRAGAECIGVLPPVINDDEYVRRRIPSAGVRVLPDCSFRAQMPRTIRDLIAVRTRIHRGNRQLRDLARSNDALLLNHSTNQSLRSLITTASRRPDLWVGVATYLTVNMIAKVKARRSMTGWGRDESTRRVTNSGAT